MAKLDACYELVVEWPNLTPVAEAKLQVCSESDLQSLRELKRLVFAEEVAYTGDL